MSIFRDYELERDEKGMPTKMTWRGDFHIPTAAQKDADKLKEWEEIYGKRPMQHRGNDGN